MVALFTLTIFVGSALLFLIQPMFARLVLPTLGGAPSVWNTAMVFYQAVLLAGYGCAHLTMRWLGPRRQVLWQLPLLLLVLPFLPVAMPSGWTPPTESNPVPWLLALMTVAVAVPFLAVSTLSPVLQKWFSVLPHPRSGDPYFLYAASNAGSILGLLSYPLWIEPNWTLEQQAHGWMWGFRGLLLLVLACAGCVWRRAATASVPGWVPSASPDSTAPISAPTARRRLYWIVLAFVPSSLVLGVTTFLSSEIAVVPLLWVVPLTIYLLTFVLAFSRHGTLLASMAVRALPIGVVGIVVALNLRATEPLGWLILLHLAVFFAAALLCHWRLAQDRPAPSHLTEYYLWLSVGGVLGGIFNGLVAPVAFDSLAEYPLAIVLACLVALPDRSKPASRRGTIADWGWPALLALAALALVLTVQPGGWPEFAGLAFALPALAAYFLSLHPRRFAFGIAALLAVGTLHQGERGRILHAERSFFGVHRVTLAPHGGYRLLMHGKTLHGIQSLNPSRQRESLAYYHRSGPAGDILALGAHDPSRRVGVVGLGVGSLAGLATPGQPWTFFEIDPVIVGLARDPRYFTFLTDSPATIRIVLGDARLSLAREPAQFDLLVIDAFSSDAIPVHLLTREAIALYTQRLAAGGILAFHISNRHLDLEPITGGLARDANLVAVVRDDTATTSADRAAGKSPSIWLAMARSREDLRPLLSDRRWQVARADEHQRVWTDDYSSLLPIFRGWK